MKWEESQVQFLTLQIAGETETKGQIKLRFRTAAGKDVVCIRSFQLTQKATKMEYKALESVLQTVSSQTGEVGSFVHAISLFLADWWSVKPNWRSGGFHD